MIIIISSNNHQQHDLDDRADAAVFAHVSLGQSLDIKISLASDCSSPSPLQFR
jgi:hypothetical protein